MCILARPSRIGGNSAVSIDSKLLGIHSNSEKCYMKGADAKLNSGTSEYNNVIIKVD